MRTDYDVASTYVASTGEAAGRILADHRIEAVEVTLDTRVDDAADQQS